MARWRVRTVVFRKGTESEATPHVSREQMLRAMRADLALSDGEMAHLPSCPQCMDLLLKLVIESEPDRPRRID
jgi:hypothetical protein